MKFIGVEGIESRIDHGLRCLEPWLWLYFFFQLVERVSYPCLFHLLHVADGIANLPRTQFLERCEFGLQQPNIEHLIVLTVPATDDSRALLQTARHHIEQAHHVFVIHKPTIDQK